MPILLGLTVGCTAGQVSDSLRARYIDYPIDEFFGHWGAPVSSSHLANGGRLYLWFSGRHSAFTHDERGTYGLIGNTAWWKGYRLKDYNPLLECRVQILTRADRRILDIRTHPDDRKSWDRQRCREVFRPVLRR